MTHAPSAHLRQVLDDGRAPTEQRRPRWHHPLEERLGEVVEIVPQAVAHPPPDDRPRYDGPGPATRRIPSHRPPDSIFMAAPLPQPVAKDDVAKDEEEGGGERDGIVPIGLTSHASLVAASLASSVIPPVAAALLSMSWAAAAAYAGS